MDGVREATKRGNKVPLVDIINVPKNDQEWEIWTFAHKDSHDKIRKAIQTKTGINLSNFIIYPIDKNHIQDFLQNNQSLHVDMDGILGIQSSDLQDVDFKKENEKIAWFYSHYLEHQSAELALGI